MVIFETSIFSKKITTLLDDEEYRALQNALIEKPHLGDIIQGSGSKPNFYALCLCQK